MIVKHRFKSNNLLAYEALYRRIKPQYRENTILQNDYKRYFYGYQGERMVDYKLKMYTVKPAMIFMDLRLKTENRYFQMDTLILTKKFIIIIETKNIRGSVEYDSDFNQFIRKDGDKEDGFKDPILQAETQKINLLTWLEERQLYNIPVESIVVISNPSTIIKHNQRDPKVLNKLIHLESLLHQLEKINQNYAREQVGITTMKKLKNYLISGHTERRPNLMDYYNLNNDYFILGIPCYKCFHYPMIRHFKKWLCPKCRCSGPTDHIRVILDHFLLHSPTITNSEFRELLQLTSSQTSYFLLNAMNLRHTGTNKGRKYHTPTIENYPQDSEFIFKRQITIN
ncbi:nuclease-related domain-containing protein [Virgibacillus flavescens]|uniref:nuclease-related domain-containing protein n=1 Tax=Virgibacillus flavescens TaxID=1611422 RepID=UPI003D32F7AB